MVIEENNQLEGILKKSGNQEVHIQQPELRGNLAALSDTNTRGHCCGGGIVHQIVSSVIVPLLDDGQKGCRCLNVS